MAVENKVYCNNRKVKYDYFMVKGYSAGMSLKGDEVGPIRSSRCNLKGSYATVRNGEVWLLGFKISKINNGAEDKESIRDIKLLLHKKEIREIESALKEDGKTLIVNCVYGVEGKIKCNISIAKGLHKYDKRRSIADKTQKRQIDRALKRK